MEQDWETFLMEDPLLTVGSRCSGISVQDRTRICKEAASKKCQHSKKDLLELATDIDLPYRHKMNKHHLCCFLSTWVQCTEKSMPPKSKFQGSAKDYETILRVLKKIKKAGF
jgi:hypothetical protein